VTRSALAAAVYDCGRVSREEARRFVEVMLSEIAHALSRGESVKLVSFGSFVVRSKGERVGAIHGPVSKRLSRRGAWLSSGPRRN